MENKKIKVALLGLGTVGGGVYKLIQRRSESMIHTVGAELEVEKILVHSLHKKREGVDTDLLTTDWKSIVNDPEIQIVIEVMGGIEPAKSMIEEALGAGKHVVTANKDLMAEHGGELLDLAAAHGCDLLFEASVAGAIPIIRPLKQCLAGNEISEVMGIVNGTTNYILTKMFEENMSLKLHLQKQQSWDMQRQIRQRMWKDWMPEERSRSFPPLPFIPEYSLKMFIQKESQRSQQKILPMQKSLTV